MLTHYSPKLEYVQNKQLFFFQIYLIEVQISYLHQSLGTTDKDRTEDQISTIKWVKQLQIIKNHRKPQGNF